MSHRCVASALDTMTEQTPSLLWACAEHWTLAQDKERGMASLNSCVRYATSIGRPGDAARILREALAVDLFADERTAIANEMIRAADLAGEPEFVLEGLALVKSTRQSGAHDDIEFAGIRAEARMFLGTPAERVRLFKCATARDATPNHRITAAIWILKYADMNGDADLAKTAIDSIDAGIVRQASSELRIEFDLVSACVLGQWDKAANAAREILHSVATAPPSVRIVPRLNASSALWRAGATEEAISASEQAYADAQASGSYRLGVTVAATLSDMNFDLDQASAANAWIEQALNTANRFPELKTHFPLWMIRILGAIYAGEPRIAASLFDDAQKHGMFEGSQLRERWRGALAARLALLRQEFAISDSELARLTDAIERAHPMSGVLDFEIATACEQLVAAGRYSEARELSERFSKSPRRNRAVLSREIRRVRVATDLGVQSSSEDAAVEN
jgi:hypothetical protein